MTSVSLCSNDLHSPFSNSYEHLKTNEKTQSDERRSEHSMSSLCTQYHYVMEQTRSFCPHGQEKLFLLLNFLSIFGTRKAH